MKLISRIGVVLMGIGLIWFLLLVYFGTYAPVNPSAETGRIYEYNYHGTVVYLTFAEQVLRFALPGTVILVVIIMSTVNARLEKNDKEWPPHQD